MPPAVEYKGAVLVYFSRNTQEPPPCIPCNFIFWVFKSCPQVYYNNMFLEFILVEVVYGPFISEVR